MAEKISTTKRYAVVTGANKGLGFEICRQLASKGIMVVLTARDDKKGLDLEAFEKLKNDGLFDHVVVFFQLDVVDPSSIAFADFIKSKFGRLDILVNNAGISGVVTDWDVLKSTGVVDNIPSECAKGVLNDAENLTKERIDKVLNKFLKDFKEDWLESKGWPTLLSAYTLSKASMNAYTRFLAKKYPTFRINCVFLGYVKIDINNNNSILSTEQGVECPVKLALLPDKGPSGLFFVRNELSSFE